MGTAILTYMSVPVALRDYYILINMFLSILGWATAFCLNQHSLLIPLILDRYVIVGNHYDAWTYGGIDPSSATSVLLELVRVFGKMHSDGWRPRRSVM